ncbi:DUF3349 domain-containing protein [Gordonia defluvii]|uniref:DUF3349 domain-containing protein n=1 Tax=Gordonia defluvii TaxID=283718 RepID=A0ABP6LL11_9ACTN|nr:DUF3349 domain-containing protein [Gordonia sp. UBA5067]
MDRPQLLASVIRWLRAGYPNGVPRDDYIPLAAILRRQLSDDEVREVANTLATDAAVEMAVESAPEIPEISRVDAGVEINKLTDELPSEADLARVRAVLAGAGWPFEEGPVRSGESHSDEDADSPE